MKLWGGRFSEGPDEMMKQFNDSFRFDRRLYAADIQGSIAYAAALEASGLLTLEEMTAIHNGLAQIKAEFDAETFAAQPDDEDIHTAVERRLHELIGPVAGKLHTGRSRNDQVATDLRLYVVGVITETRALLTELQGAMVAQAEANLEVLMPGFTHLQPAQPILFSHWLMSYFWMLERDKSRLADALARTAVSPLGSGALAGNPFGVDRKALAESLGMPGVSMNSLDAVSDRDFVAELLFANALIAVHISKLAEDLILFSSPAFGFVRIGEGFSTGSSLMPQKRNPDSMELARGKSGRVIGALVTLLTVLKGLPSTYNKDLQEDKEALFDSVDNLSLTLAVVTGVVASLTVSPQKMAAQLDEAMLATDLAEYLVRKGMPFRQAHEQVGEVIRYAEEQGVMLSQVPLDVYRGIAPEFGEDVKAVFDFMAAVEKKDSTGGTAPQDVRAQIAAARELLAE